MSTEMESLRPADRIEADIAHTRAKMSETLHALEEKLAPQRLLNKGMDAVRETISQGSSDLGDRLFRNPAPVALVALGLGWFLFGNGRRSAEKSVAQTAADEIPTETGIDGGGGQPWRNIVVRHPLTVGLMGAAMGMVASMLLPASRLEDEWIGEASDELRREAQNIARQAMDRAQRAAETAAAEAVSAAVSSVAEDLVPRDRI